MEITTQNFETEVLNAHLPVLVDFGADWCPPCRMLAPIVHDLEVKYADKMRVGTVNVDHYPELQQQFGVMGLPTLILFQHGQPVKRLVGFKPREHLEAALLPLLEGETV